MAKFRDAIADYFRQHPGVWVDSTILARIGGRNAWRTRISEARVTLGMRILNKQVQRWHGDQQWRASFYRYEPPQITAGQGELFDQTA